MLIRMFGVFGAMLSYGYFSQGWYFSKPTIRARFLRKKPAIEAESASPAE